MICFLAKKIITLYPVRVRISLKKTQPGRRPGCIFFSETCPSGRFRFFFSETCLRRGCVFFGRFLSRFRFLSEVSFLMYSRIRMSMYENKSQPIDRFSSYIAIYNCTYQVMDSPTLYNLGESAMFYDDSFVFLKLKY